jgi:hypothetical protein
MSSVPYNTSTCIDARTIPLASKCLIKSNNKGSKFWFQRSEDRGQKTDGKNAG